MVKTHFRFRNLSDFADQLPGGDSYTWKQWATSGGISKRWLVTWLEGIFIAWAQWKWIRIRIFHNTWQFQGFRWQIQNLLAWICFDVRHLSGEGASGLKPTWGYGASNSQELVWLDDWNSQLWLKKLVVCLLWKYFIQAISSDVKTWGRRGRSWRKVIWWPSW